MIPRIIIYTDRLPEGAGGGTVAFIILIRPKYRDDKGIHAHEIEHARQWWVTLGAHSLLYRFVPRYRLWSEARAYRQQMKYPNRHGGFLSLDAAAAKLTNPQYRLNISIEEARRAISRN